VSRPPVPDARRRPAHRASTKARTGATCRPPVPGDAHTCPCRCTTGSPSPGTELRRNARDRSRRPARRAPPHTPGAVETEARLRDSATVVLEATPHHAVGSRELARGPPARHLNTIDSAGVTDRLVLIDGYALRTQLTGGGRQTTAPQHLRIRNRAQRPSDSATAHGRPPSPARRPPGRHHGSPRRSPPDTHPRVGPPR